MSGAKRTPGLRDKVVFSGRCQVGNARALEQLHETNDVRSLAHALMNVKSDRRKAWLTDELAEAKASLIEARELEQAHLVDCAQCTDAQIARVQRLGPTTAC